MRKYHALFLMMIIIFLILNIGCMSEMKETTNVFSQNLIYRNGDFGLKIKIPNNWQQTEEDKRLIQELMDKQGTQEKTIVVISKYPIKDRKNDNAIMVWNTVDMTMYPKITSEEYALKVKETAEKEPADISVKNPYIEKVDGIDFYVLELKSADNRAVQKNYSAVIKGYAHNFAFTYTTQEDLAIFNEIIKSIKLDK